MVRLLFCFFVTSALAIELSPPFWKTKPEVYRKMKEERYVAVSAHTDEVEKGKLLKVVAAGVIHAPVSFTHDQVLNFKDYPHFLSYIVDSPYDSTTKNVFLHGALLGYHVHMTIHVDAEETTTGKRLKWKTIEGHFKGMEGVIEENRLDGEHTEISLNSAYQGPSLGLPGFILNWGLEFAAQRTASSMRSHIESEWEKSKKH